MIPIFSVRKGATFYSASTQNGILYLRKTEHGRTTLTHLPTAHTGNRELVREAFLWLLNELGVEILEEA